MESLECRVRSPDPLASSCTISEFESTDMVFTDEVIHEEVRSQPNEQLSQQSIDEPVSS